MNKQNNESSQEKLSFSGLSTLSFLEAGTDAEVLLLTDRTASSLSEASSDKDMSAISRWQLGCENFLTVNTIYCCYRPSLAVTQLAFKGKIF